MNGNLLNLIVRTSIPWPRTTSSKAKQCCAFLQNPDLEECNGHYWSLVTRMWMWVVGTVSFIKRGDESFRSRSNHPTCDSPLLPNSHSDYWDGDLEDTSCTVCRSSSIIYSICYHAKLNTSIVISSSCKMLREVKVHTLMPPVTV